MNRQHRPDFLLFYSKFCAASQKVKEALSSSRLRPPTTLLICLDDKDKRTLPSWVKCVPTLLSTKDNAVFEGPAIFSILQTEATEANASVGPQPFPYDVPGSAFLDQQPVAGNLDASFAPLQVPAESAGTKSKEGVNEAFDRLMAARNSEVHSRARP